MNRKKLLFLLFISLLIGDFAKAQDPHFTQFYANPLYLNPAFAGSARCPRFVLNYRNQWPGIANTYVTYAASYDQHFDAIGGGLGLSVMHDQAGDGKLSQTWINTMYSYQLNVTRKFTIRAGFQASYIQKSIDPNNLTFGDMIDPRSGFVYPTREENIRGRAKPMFDLSAGVVGYTKNFFVGAAFHHIAPTSTRNEAFIATSILPTKITGHAGATIPIGNDGDVTVSPNIIFQQQEKFQTLNLGFYFNKGPFVGGLWYRNEDAVIILLGINYKAFRFGYSYDVTTSKLGSTSNGSHELSMGWQLYCKPKKKKFRTISCPSF